MGTGGTLSGCGKFLREKKPDIKIVGVDPVGSLYYDFVKTGRITKAFSYKVEGIGEDFFPTTMNLKILDDIVRVDDKECFLMTRDMTRLEGIFCGGSGGAAVAGAVKWAREHGKRGTKILVFLADGGQKYVSKIFNDDWMRENGFFDEGPGIGTVKDLLGARYRSKLITVTPSSTVRDVIDKLKSHGISQLPVIESGKLKGIVHEVDLLTLLVKGEKTLDSPIGDLAEADYATVTPDTKVELLKSVLSDAKVALVMESDEVVGLVTKIDLVDFLAKQQHPSIAPRSS
jgi:cystathionine beta-synthase